MNGKAGGAQWPTIQDWITNLAQTGGQDLCGELTTSCQNTVAYQQCLDAPEANFVWWAIVNFNNFLGALDQAITKCGGELGQQAGTMVNQFYTARTVRCSPCYFILSADCNSYFQTTSDK